VKFSCWDGKVSKEFRLPKTVTGAFGAPKEASSTALIRGQELEAVSNIIVIEKRALVRECLTTCLKSALGPAIISFLDVDSWIEVMEQTSPCLVVLSTGGQDGDAKSVHRDITLLGRVASHLPIILLADAEDPDEIINALRHGAKGYIPTSASLKIAIEAMRLVKAGGVYAPANSLINANLKSSKDATGSGGSNAVHKLFTARQIAVLEALRKGKANKIIAYELNMRESTVKVHVRNIMKKFRAKNRTEVAYMAQSLLNHDNSPL
jgi:DNA-binding NarL/FixJ family response regulator